MAQLHEVSYWNNLRRFALTYFVFFSVIVQQLGQLSRYSDGLRCGLAEILHNIFLYCTVPRPALGHTHLPLR
jgi:hypothetical protein